MKRILILSIAMVFGIALAKFHCDREIEGVKEEATLKSPLVVATRLGVTQIPLASVYPFNWHVVCALLPYTSDDDLDSIFGSTRRVRYAWQSDDSYWTLAFSDKTEVRLVKIPRKEIGDFVIRNAPALATREDHCATRDAAVIKIALDTKVDPIQVYFTFMR